MRRGKIRSGPRSLLARALMAALWLLLPGVRAAQADVLPPENAAPVPNPSANLAQAQGASAQSPSPDAATAPAAPTSPGASSKAPLHAHTLPGHVRRKPSPATPPPPPPAAVVAPAPPPPDWPINDKPVAATVVWDSRGLQIDADNSSLAQILKDVSTDTGARVEGLNSDQRVFGSYGPGPARQVLSDLLDGAGYNVLMVGDQGEGTPREIVLSALPNEGAGAGSRNNLSTQEDYEPESEAEPEPPPPPQNQPPVPQRTPQQIYQEMQQRRQQQQMQPQNAPPENNP